MAFATYTAEGDAHFTIACRQCHMMLPPVRDWDYYSTVDGHCQVPVVLSLRVDAQFVGAHDVRQELRGVLQLLVVHPERVHRIGAVVHVDCTRVRGILGLLGVVTNAGPSQWAHVSQVCLLASTLYARRDIWAWACRILARVVRRVDWSQPTHVGDAIAATITCLLNVSWDRVKVRASTRPWACTGGSACR